MGFLRYCRAVAFASFKHSLDLAQAVIFGAVVILGLASQIAPPVKAWVANLSTWETASIVLGSIIGIRLFIFAPYWMWKEQKERADALAEKLQGNGSAGVRAEIERLKNKKIARMLTGLDRDEDDD